MNRCTQECNRDHVDRCLPDIRFDGYALDAGVSLTSMARSSAELQSSFVKPKDRVSFEVSNR